MERKWKDEQIEFLKTQYPVHGLLFCVDNLPFNRSSVKSKVDKMGLKKNENWRYNKESFSKVISESTNYTDVTRKLGIIKTYGNRKTIKKYIELYGLDVSHFDFGVSNRRQGVSFQLDDILVENSTYSHTSNLKHKLYDAGLKERKCELCGQGEEWQGKHMSLILDHINGVNNDHRRENLRIVCPNCNATLDTHGGKNYSRNTCYATEG